jgi:hypothetical protein
VTDIPPWLHAIQVVYTNWRGETRERRLVPISLWYGYTEQHGEPQYLLKALDCEDGREKDFALLGLRGPPPPALSE